LLYLPDPQLKDYIVDFSFLNSVQKGLFEKLIEENEVEKHSSLNNFGYYLFLNKLAIHFMRPEDEEVQNQRINSS